MSKKMWYENCYRRHLCDMHIEDWNEEFLRDFSPEEYVENLKIAKAESAMLYFQSHVGHCHYPTKTGHMHNCFKGREDMIKRLEKLCHDNHIYVTGYYSLIYNTYEHDRHPEWRMLREDGTSARVCDDGSTQSGFSTAKTSRYGLCCPNNLEYREFVYAQIEEMLDYFEVDGMFYDMPFWPHVCYCDSCRKRWQEEVGGELPKSDMSDPIYRLFMDKHRKWMGEFIQGVTEKTKSYAKKAISVEHNFAMAIAARGPIPGCAEEVNEACDYVGGDLYGGVLEHSFTCKFYRNITKNEPFEYMFGRCTPGLSVHTVTKSPDQMLASTFLTAAHHGATFVIDAIDPVGTLDRRVYERLGNVFEQIIPYEKYFKGNMVEDVGVYYSMKSLFDLHGNDFIGKNCAINTVKTMIKNHIPVGVTGGFHDLNKYKAVVAPYLTMEDSYDNERLIRYVENGGTLYISGGDNETLIEKLLEAKVIGWTDSKYAYVAPKAGMDFGWYNEKYPLPFTAYAPILSDVNEEDVIATVTFPYTSETETRYASIHSNPPGIKTDMPAMIKKSVGKGTVIWSAFPLENAENYEYNQILLKLLSISKPSFKADANEDMELVLFENESELYLSAVQLSDSYHIAPNSSFTVQVKCDKPKKIVKLNDDVPVEFTYDGEYVKFNTGGFKIGAMYLIQKL